MILPHGSRGALALFGGRRVRLGFSTRVAIRAACDTLGLRPGDEVLVPAWNCGSELDPLLDAGLKVRLYAADGQGTVDPRVIAALVGPRTRAVYLTHYFGVLQPRTAEIRTLCDDHGLRLIEDCALSLLSGPEPSGGRAGDVAVFCFHKFFPVIGGGALAVNAPDLPDPPPFPRAAPLHPVLRHLARTVAERILGKNVLGALRRYGRGGPDPASGDGLPDMPGHYYFDPRLRDRAISRLTLRALARIDVAACIVARQANHDRLQDRLAGTAGLTPLFRALPFDAVPMGLPLIVAGGHRDRLVAALQAEGIAASAWWGGYHRGLDFAGQTEARMLKDSLLFLPVQPHPDADGVDHAAVRTAALHAWLG